jgi:prevent-host-death family protein
MNAVTVRELRNHGGDVLTRVAAGEAVIITRDGAEVAELRPLARRAVSIRDLIARRSALPLVDPTRLRSDIDSALDSSL